MNKMLAARLIRRIRLIIANRVEFYCFAYLHIITWRLLVRVYRQPLSAMLNTVKLGSRKYFSLPNYSWTNLLCPLFVYVVV